MKKLSIIWLLYTITLGYLSTYAEGGESFLEKFFIGILAANVILAIYITFNLILNGCVQYLNVRFKFLPPKKFKNKVTPIYKITSFTNDWNTIYKYQLEWEDIDMGDIELYLIPFSSLFQKYRYVQCSFRYEFEERLENIQNIEELYETALEVKKIKDKKENDVYAREINKLNELNKTFLENYEHP